MLMLNCEGMVSIQYVFHKKELDVLGTEKTHGHRLGRVRERPEETTCP